MTIKIINTPSDVDSLPTVLWDNVFAKGVLSAVGGTPTSYPVGNAVTEDTVTYWKPLSLPASIVVDAGVPTEADCFAVVGHDCGSRVSTLTLESSVDNVSWTTRASILPTDDTTIMVLFPVVSARYWRLVVSGSAAPIISVVMLGKRFNFPAGVKAPYKPVWLSQTYELIVAQTMGGQFLGNKVIKTGGETQINLVAFERSYAENDLLPFREHYNLGKAFVFASGPSIFEKDVGYVYRKEGSILSPTFDTNGSWMSVSMEVYCYGK
jgi:hypothetical protein